MLQVLSVYTTNGHIRDCANTKQKWADKGTNADVILGIF